MHRNAGFTLVEVLIAMAITAFVAVVGLWSSISMYLDGRLIFIFFASVAFVFSKYINDKK